MKNMLLLKNILLLTVLLLLGSAVHAQEQAEGVLILDGPSTKMLGKVQMETVPQEDGSEIKRPNPWVPGNVIIVRQIDEQTAAGLKVQDGSTVQAGKAYRIHENHELSFITDVDLKKSNQRLAKQFGIKPPKRSKRAR